MKNNLYIKFQSILMITLFILFLFGCSHTNNSPVNTNENPKVTSFEISKDSVLINPYSFAPLTALIKFSSTTSAYSKMTVKGKNGTNSDISHTFNDYGINHNIAILGLYPDFENTVNIELYDNHNKLISTSSVKITTGKLPKNMPINFQTSTLNYSKMEAGLNLVSNYSTLSPQIPYMLDAWGDIRWYLNYTTNYLLFNCEYECGIARLKNGNYFFGDNKSNKIYEVDILGKIVNYWTFPGYEFHHHVIEKSDGNFLICVNKLGSTDEQQTPTYEDYVIEINRKNGSVINEWDLKQSLQSNRYVLTDDPGDWIHVNGIAFDESDNTLIVSGRFQGVAKLTYDNRLKWILSPHKGWAKNGRGEDLNQFLLTPLDANGNIISDSLILDGYNNHKDFEWNWYQHSPFIMPNGNLLIFDNGTFRNYNPSPTTNYSRAVEYKIDTYNMTVKQVWSYGKERGMECFSEIVSRVEYLPKTNHILFCPGFNVINSNGRGGKIIEIDYNTKEVIFETSINTENAWGFHRTDRMLLYPENNIQNNTY